MGFWVQVRKSQKMVNKWYKSIYFNFLIFKLKFSQYFYNNFKGFSKEDF